jgi:hypothetical protein
MQLIIPFYLTNPGIQRRITVRHVFKFIKFSTELQYQFHGSQISLSLESKINSLIPTLNDRSQTSSNVYLKFFKGKDLARDYTINT